MIPVKSKYILGIIAASNRFLKSSRILNSFDKYNGIQKRTLEKYVNNICARFSSTATSRSSCYWCELDGIKKYDFWCSCTLLICLNKSLVGIWRDQ